MFKFNELSIIKDYLTIDVEVEDEEMYEGIYIDKIEICNHLEYNSDSATCTTHTIPLDDTYCEVLEPEGGPYKHVKIKLSNSALFALTNEKCSTNDLLFVFITPDGTFSPDIPCDETGTLVKTVVNPYPFYCAGMNYLKQLSDTCNISRDFIDYILRYKGFELSLKTGNYTNAIEFYKLLSKKKTSITKTGGCNCGH